MNLDDLRRSLRSRAETFVRRTWMKYVLRGSGRADKHRLLDFVYKLPDPWRMDTPMEQYRFAESNRLLHDHLIAPAPRVESILEIGCGEGHQSAHLAALCDRLTGIDVSATAVARARRRLPGAELVAGDLLQQPWVGEGRRFDVVTAFEVLYYIKDIPRVLDAMNKLGRACIVSWYGPTARLTETSVRTMPIEGEATLQFEDTRWTVAWWRNP